MRCATGFYESDTALKQYDLIILFIYLFILLAILVRKRRLAHGKFLREHILCKTTMQAHL